MNERRNIVGEMPAQGFDRRPAVQTMGVVRLVGMDCSEDSRSVVDIREHDLHADSAKRKRALLRQIWDLLNSDYCHEMQIHFLPEPTFPASRTRAG